MWAAVVGRITEEHLSLAEQSFPGILDMYQRMKDKPRTFLQLLWQYETEMTRDGLGISQST